VKGTFKLGRLLEMRFSTCLFNSASEELIVVGKIVVVVVNVDVEIEVVEDVDEVVVDVDVVGNVVVEEFVVELLEKVIATLFPAYTTPLAG
jgi:hypothetical protein